MAAGHRPRRAICRPNGVEGSLVHRSGRRYARVEHRLERDALYNRERHGQRAGCRAPRTPGVGAIGRRRRTSPGASYADVGDWIGAATSFDAMSATATAAMTLTDRDRPAERVAGAYVSAGTFAMVGERPILGRDFRREDDRPGAAPVAIVNASIWKNRYGGDAAIVGRSVDVNGVATTIVGVMRDGFRFPLVHDVWQPLASMPGITSGARDARTLRVAARLAHGRTMAAARQEMDAIAARLAAAYPATNANVRTAIEPYTGRFELANPWNAMLAAVSIVLLIACANIANLLISRAAYRTREIAIRRTLGATRWRLLRQLLVERLLLAFAGGAAGVFVRRDRRALLRYAATPSAPWWGLLGPRRNTRLRYRDRTPALREQVHQLDPDLPLVDVRTLTSLVDGTRFANTVFAAMFSIAAVLGLLLAAIGLHAVTAYAIARGTAEIGIRMALGARRSQVIWLFVAQTAAPLACGFLFGLAGAFGVGQFVSGMLTGTSPQDPATFAAISLTLVLVVLAAAFVPARRAARIDPAIALRYE